MDANRVYGVLFATACRYARAGSGPSMAATAHVMSLGPIAVAAQPAPELAQRLARRAAPARYLDFARHDRLASRVCAEEKMGAATRHRRVSEGEIQCSQ